MEYFTLFINIVLYLLLAFAFFKEYLVPSKKVPSPGAILIFLFGIFALLGLSFFQIMCVEDYRWGYFFIAPFILYLSWILIKLLYTGLFEKTRGLEPLIFPDFIKELLYKLYSWRCLRVIAMVMILILMWVVLEKIFEINSYPDIPLHPMCRCTLTPVTELG